MVLPPLPSAVPPCSQGRPCMGCAYVYGSGRAPCPPLPAGSAQLTPNPVFLRTPLSIELRGVNEVQQVLQQRKFITVGDRRFKAGGAF